MAAQRIVGIKEMVDAGLQEVPPIYVRPTEDRPAVWPGSDSSVDHPKCLDAQIPVIDLSHLDAPAQSESEEMVRKLTVQQIGQACRDWGFFQIINHGIPYNTIHQLRQAAKSFFELPIEEKMKYNHEGFRAPIVYSTSFNPKFERTREWRDFLTFNPKFQPTREWRDFLNSCGFPGFCDGLHEAPGVSKEPLFEYITLVEDLVGTLYKAIFESLGLNDTDIEHMVPKIPCLAMAINYYPPCPDPSLTLGLSAHSDICGLTILHPDEVLGLQINHNGNWISLDPISKQALVVNLGDQIEILSNGKYKSIEHRVATNVQKTRMSIACFFGPEPSTVVGPIPKLLNDNNQSLYKSTKFEDYLQNFYNNKLLSNRGTLQLAKISQD